MTAIVYGERAADGQFEAVSELDRLLEDFSIQVAEPSRAALFRAGQQFRRCTDRRPEGLQCPSCGAGQSVHCGACGEALSPRQHIAADFIIGGHATVDADALISFDMGFYDTCFPSLTVHPE